MTPTETCRSRSQELRRANVCKGSLSTPSPRHWSHTGTMPRGPRYHVPYLFRAWQSHCSLGDTRPLGRGERTPFPARGPSGTWSQGVLWLFPLVPNQPSAKNTQVSPVTQRQKCYSTCLQQKRACLLLDRTGHRCWFLNTVWTTGALHFTAKWAETSNEEGTGPNTALKNPSFYHHHLNQPFFQETGSRLQQWWVPSVYTSKWTVKRNQCI